MMRWSLSTITHVDVDNTGVQKCSIESYDSMEILKFPQNCTKFPNLENGYQNSNLMSEYALNDEHFV